MRGEGGENRERVLVRGGVCASVLILISIETYMRAGI
jgi:hypothetical protein